MSTKFWEINIKDSNEKDRLCHVKILCNGVNVYSFTGTNISDCLVKVSDLIRTMENHWFDFGDPSSMIGKNIFWSDIPCVILGLSEDGEIEYRDLSNICDNVFYGSRIWRTDVLSPDLSTTPLMGSMADSEKKLTKIN